MPRPDNRHASGIGFLCEHRPKDDLCALINGFDRHCLRLTGLATRRVNPQVNLHRPKIGNRQSRGILQAARQKFIAGLTLIRRAPKAPQAPVPKDQFSARSHPARCPA